MPMLFPNGARDLPPRCIQKGDPSLRLKNGSAQGDTNGVAQRWWNHLVRGDFFANLISYRDARRDKRKRVNTP